MGMREESAPYQVKYQTDYNLLPATKGNEMDGEVFMVCLGLIRCPPGEHTERHPLKGMRGPASQPTSRSADTQLKITES